MKSKILNIKKVSMSVFFILLGGCATSNYSKITVAERADNLNGTPEWASVTKPSYEADGNRYFLGYVEVDGDASKSAALNMSDEKAFSEPMRAIVDNFMEQNQVGEDLTSSTGQRIISATRGMRPQMPSLHIAKRYWEVIENRSSGSSNYVKSRLRVYSLAEIPIADLEKAKQSFLSNLSNNTEVKKILRDVGAKQREKILNAESEK